MLSRVGGAGRAGAFRRTGVVERGDRGYCSPCIAGFFAVRRIRDVDSLIRHTESLLENPQAQPPELLHSATADPMLTAVAALQRLWVTRFGQAEASARSRQNVIDAPPEPLLLLDRRRRVRNANAAARDLFNLDTTALQAGGPGGRMVADRDLAGLIRDPKVLDAVDVTLNERRPTEAEFTLPSPERTYRAFIVSMPEPTEESSAIIVALSDQIERMPADFVANASHELRTPLAAILGFIETLRGPAKDDTKARDAFLEIMSKQAARMSRLIDDLLSLSRIELREHAKPADAVDISNVLRATVELLQVEADRGRTRIHTNIPPDLPKALGDHGDLS